MPQHPRPAPDYLRRDLGDEYMLYDHDGDLVHVLNGTAREIFLLCDGSRSAEQVAQEFADRYDEATSAHSDALAVIDELAEKGLLDLS